MSDRLVTGWGRQGSRFSTGRPDVLVSYSSRQWDLARQVVAIIEAHGLVCWWAPRDVRPGHRYTAEIDRAVESCHAVVLILTEDAVKSPHVRREMRCGERKRKPVVAMQFEPCEPGALLTPRTQSYVYRFDDWSDMVDADDPLAFELILALKGCSSEIRNRLLQEAKWSAVRHGRDNQLNWSEIVSQTKEGLRRRNELLFTQPEESIEPTSSVSQSTPRPAEDRPIIDRALLIFGATPVAEVHALARGLANLGTACDLCWVEDPALRDRLDAPYDALIAILDATAIAHKATLAVFERSVARPCVGLLTGPERVPPELSYLLATEHLLHARDRPLGEFADELHFHLHADRESASDPTTEPNMAAAVVMPFAIAGVTGGFGYAYRWMFNSDVRPWWWATVALLVTGAISASATLGEWVAKRENQHFLPVKERFGHDMGSNVAACLVGAAVLAIVVWPINAFTGATLPYFGTGLTLWASLLAVCVPLTVRKHLRKVRELEAASKRQDGSEQRHRR
jgi:hypothetical protein